MLVLGIDTSTKMGGLGLFDSEKGLLGEYNLNLKRTHSERLMPLLDQLLQAADISVKEIDGVAVTVGPGSFTGTRIGVTTAKTLAQLENWPIVGVSTLEVTAWNLWGISGRIVPIFDARNRRVYTAQFMSTPTGLKRLTEDQGMVIDELVDQLRKGEDSLYFLGDALLLYQDFLTEQLTQRVMDAPRAFWLPKGSWVANLGAIKLANGEQNDLFSLTPNYLKPSQAEMNWRKKHGK